MEFPNGDVVSYVDTAIRLEVPDPDAPGAFDVQVNDDESTRVGWYPISNMPLCSRDFD